MKIHPPFWLFLFLTAAALPGCRAKNALPGVPVGDIDTLAAAPAPMPKSPFHITARADPHHFEKGQPVTLRIEIENTSKESAELQFSAGQSFDFSAEREGDKDFVWNYAMNKRFMQSLRTISVEGGKSRNFETVWNGAKPGTYIIRGKITANGGLDAAPFQIVVK